MSQPQPKGLHRLCRVNGLTSQKGLRLNHSSATAYFDLDTHEKLKLAGKFSTESNTNTNTNTNANQLELQRRIPILIDGNPGGPVLLLPKNIQVLPDINMDHDNNNNNDDNDVFVCSIGVGRKSICHPIFHATSTDERTQTIITQHKLSCDSDINKTNTNATTTSTNHIVDKEKEGGIRCRGNLEAIEQYLKLCIIGYNAKVCADTSVSGPLIFKVTDLNVARALSKISSTNKNDVNISLDPSLNTLLSRITKMIQVLLKKRIIFFKFEPHRIPMDGYGLGSLKSDNYNHNYNPNYWKARYAALKSGAFKIYPCPHKTYLDAMEVRYIYIDSTSKTTTSNNAICIKQEIFLDYGRNEIKLYVRNAAHLNELHRLLPKTLAQVDPQIFWSVLLHPNIFLATLGDYDANPHWSGETKQHDDDDNMNVTNANVILEWSHFLTTVLYNNQTLWQQAVQESGVYLPSSAIHGNDWSIDSTDAHKSISKNAAIAALFMMIQMAGDTRVKNETRQEEERSVSIEMLESYKGTELERVVHAFSGIV